MSSPLLAGYMLGKFTITLTYPGLSDDSYELQLCEGVQWATKPTVCGPLPNGTLTYITLISWPFTAAACTRPSYRSGGGSRQLGRDARGGLGVERWANGTTGCP